MLETLNLIEIPLTLTRLNDFDASILDHGTTGWVRAVVATQNGPMYVGFLDRWWLIGDQSKTDFHSYFYKFEL